MRRRPSPKQQKLARIRLVARVQVAYERLREIVRRHASDPEYLGTIEAARNRLATLNLALAMLAVQGWQ